MNTKLVLLLLISLTLSACKSPEATLCTFTYDETVKNSAVDPALSKRFGRSAGFFDDAKPAISRDGNNIKLIFSATKAVDGRRLLHEDAFVVIVDACTRKVVDNYDGTW